MVHGNAGRFQLVHQRQHLVQRSEEGGGFGDLRTDVAIDAANGQMGQGGGLPIGRQCLAVWNAELVFLQAGGDVGVGGRIHIRVDAQRDRCLQVQFAGDLVQPFQFGQRFHVEAADASRECLTDLVGRFAHAREHHLCRIAAGRHHTGQFAARHHVEAGAQAGKQLQNGQVAVGLHGIADARVTTGQCLGEALPGGLDGLAAVHIEGRAVLAGQGQQAVRAGLQLAIGRALQPAVGGVEGVGRAGRCGGCSGGSRRRCVDGSGRCGSCGSGSGGTGHASDAGKEPEGRIREKDCPQNGQ